MSERMVIGPTGEYPDGKLSDDDEGALNVRVGHSMAGGIGLVVIDFFACVVWATMPRRQALEFAAVLTAHAEMLPDLPSSGLSPLGLPMTLALDERLNLIRMTLESPAYMVGLGKPSALRLAKQISDLAQKLPAEEMPA